MRYKNISWTAKEYDALVKINESFPSKELASLIKKMDEARAKTEAPVKQLFAVPHAKQIAYDVLGSRLRYNPVMNAAWYGKMNRQLKDSGMTSSLFRKAARLARDQWKGKVYFDTLIFSAAKLIALGSPGRVKQVFTGFAGDELLE